MTDIWLGMTEFFTEHRGRIFWLFFIILGIFVIGGIFLNLFLIDILLGLVMIIIGIHRLETEHHKRIMEKEQGKINETINYMAQWLDANHDYVKNMRSKHDNRIFGLDRKRAELDKRIEMNHRDLVRKIIEIENKLNEITMTYTRGEKIRSGRDKKK